MKAQRGVFMQNILFKCEGMYKSFGPTKALDNVDLIVKRGEIHGLIGENGSGKSTLSSIIAAVQKSDSGKMYLKGKEFTAGSVLEASLNGICMIVQEQGTFPSVTVAANVFVGKESLFLRNGLMDLKKLNSETSIALEAIGIKNINPKAALGSLSFEERKLVELARAMYVKPKLLIIDETSNALSIRGREILYNVMQRMRERGNSVLFISHDIDEVMEICDKLTVLRDGHHIKSLNKKEFDTNTIRGLMVGRTVSENYYRSDYDSSHQDRVAVRLNNVSDKMLNNISLELHYAEILGLGGLADCGMHRVGQLAFGLYSPDRGTVELGNNKIIASPRIAMDNKMAYIPKDRDREALMTTASIKDNICITSYDKLKKGIFISRKDEKEFAGKWSEVLSIKMSGVEQPIMQLSGGNKQKVSVAKWLGTDADIYIFDCPTRGIDIGVKAAIYKLLYDLKKRGKAVLMISEELPELIGMSDRVLILKDGVITGEFERSSDLTEHTVIQYMI